jgi:N-acetylmuramoyl-L-alanine amidase
LFGYHSTGAKIAKLVVRNCEFAFDEPELQSIDRMTRTLPALLFLLVAVLANPADATAQTRAGSKINTIVIDAGHGGSDAGARGEFSTEAQITLELALKLEPILKEELPTTKIVMTRRTDVFDNVREKARIANDAHGDLFVCIHVNAMPPVPHKEFLRYETVTYYTGKGKKKKKHTKKEPVYRHWTTPSPAHGTGTYVYAADRADEKAKGLIEDQRFESEAEVQDIPDPSSPEAIIKARLWSQKFFKNSVKLGTLIENEFTKLGRNSWGVLQRNYKGIWVLQATNMPAVLIETGFITDQDVEAYLNSDKGQNELVRAIADAILQYKAMVDAPKGNGVDSTANGKGVPGKPVNGTPSGPKPVAIMPPPGSKKDN